MWLVACRVGAMPRLAELEGERALFVYITRETFGSWITMCGGAEISYQTSDEHPSVSFLKHFIYVSSMYVILPLCKHAPRLYYL